MAPLLNLDDVELAQLIATAALRLDGRAADRTSAARLRELAGRSQQPGMPWGDLVVVNGGRIRQGTDAGSRVVFP